MFANMPARRCLISAPCGLFLWTALATGCAGAKATIAAPTSEVPISLSQGIPDDAGKTLLTGKELKPVGEVYAHYRRWSWLYGAVRSTKPIDISEDINADVRSAGGEAVTEFSVRSAHCLANLLWPLMWLPIWPGCVEVDVKGTVVRRVPPAAVAAGTGPVEAEGAP